MIGSIGSGVPPISNSGAGGCPTGCLSMRMFRTVCMSDPLRAGTKSSSLSTPPDVLPDRKRRPCVLSPAPSFFQKYVQWLHHWRVLAGF